MNDVTFTVKRRFFTPTYTIGKFHDTTGKPMCDTLEDFDRDANRDGDLNDPGEQKVYSQTCIPRGRYRVTMEMSPHFGRRLPYLHDVPGFTGILIHNGTNPGHTLGCVLVGENKVKGGLVNARHWSDLINKMIDDLIIGGHRVFINIT